MPDEKVRYGFQFVSPSGSVVESSKEFYNTAKEALDAADDRRKADNAPTDQSAIVRLIRDDGNPVTNDDLKHSKR